MLLGFTIDIVFLYYLKIDNTLSWLISKAAKTVSGQGHIFAFCEAHWLDVWMNEGIVIFNGNFLRVFANPLTSYRQCVNDRWWYHQLQKFLEFSRRDVPSLKWHCPDGPFLWWGTIYIWIRSEGASNIQNWYHDHVSRPPNSLHNNSRIFWTCLTMYEQGVVNRSLVCK